MTKDEFECREAVGRAHEVADEVIESAFVMVENRWPDIKQPPAEMVIGVANIIARFVK